MTGCHGNGHFPTFRDFSYSCTPTTQKFSLDFDGIKSKMILKLESVHCTRIIQIIKIAHRKKLSSAKMSCQGDILHRTRTGIVPLISPPIDSTEPRAGGEAGCSGGSHLDLEGHDFKLN